MYNYNLDKIGHNYGSVRGLTGSGVDRHEKPDPDPNTKDQWILIRFDKIIPLKYFLNSMMIKRDSDFFCDVNLVDS